MTFLDNWPLAAILAVAVISQLLAIEFGFRLGHVRQGKPNKSQMAQVRAIMGASLGLLAFMLAFSFNTAQQHFEERSRAYLFEVNAIDSAYRGAGLLTDGPRAQARALLREFADVRLATSRYVRDNDVAAVVEKIRESERIHAALWAIAEQTAREGDVYRDGGIFAQAVSDMVTAHDNRLQVALFNRISPIIWLTLWGMALLSMAVMGYQAGLTGTRSSFATWTLAATLAFVIVLITDLDRPRMTLFEMKQDLLVALRDRMDGQDPWEGNSRSRE